MHRIDTQTAVAGMFGAGKNGYTNGDNATGQSATQLDADVFNAYQEEICAVIEGAGIALQKGENSQLLEAISRLMVNRALMQDNNLSDLTDVPTAHRNLQLGALAVKNGLTAEDVGALSINGGQVRGHTGFSERISIGQDGTGNFGMDGVAAINIGDSDTGFICPDDGYLDLYTNNSLQIRFASGAGIYPYDNVISSKEFQSTSADNFRMRQAGRSAFTRFDGSDLYLMISDSETGEWNTMRPFRYNLAGQFTEFQTLRANGDITAAGNIRAGNGGGFMQGDGNIYGGAWGGYLINYLQSNMVTSFRMVDVQEWPAWNAGGYGWHPGRVVVGCPNVNGDQYIDSIQHAALQMFKPATGWIGIETA